MQAVEEQTLEQALQRVGEMESHARRILRRLAAIGHLPEHADVLDIGAAQGLFLAAVARMGHRPIGLEPAETAHRVSAELAERLGVMLDIRQGMAEQLPFPDESFDVVHSSSVWEHVDDPDQCSREVYRVLRPGGLFWVGTTNALCPRQNEIRGFPLFGWYPGRLKRRIMRWALAKRPNLVGHTDRPGIHWFTPRSARQMLASAGFSRVYDRWQLRLPDEGGRIHAAVIRFLGVCPPARWMVHVLVEGSSFGAVK